MQCTLTDNVVININTAIVFTIAMGKFIFVSDIVTNLLYKSLGATDKSIVGKYSGIYVLTVEVFQIFWYYNNINYITQLYYWVTNIFLYVSLKLRIRKH